MQTRRGWAQVVTLSALAGAAIALSQIKYQWDKPLAGPPAVMGVAADRPEAGPTGANVAPRSAPLLPSTLKDKLATLEPAIKQMVERRLAREFASPNTAKLAACFKPGTPNEVMEAFRLAEAIHAPFGDRFNVGPRWTSTALTPGGSQLGKPITITWSIVPDGTDVQGFNGEPDAPSNLRAYLNGIYGNEATWLPILQSVFDRWSQVSGIKYVYEPNDDGAALRNPEDPLNPGTFLPSTAFGVAGVRGDVRISGHTLDGNSGTLAYNFYPDEFDATGGDMVIDTGDNFFTNTAGNSLRLRNVVSHEHGHGMGQPHVCPIESTKLMEPFVSTIYDGPRHDDIRHAQFSYGDIYEPNDTPATATQLNTSDCGTLVVGALPTPAGPAAGALTQLNLSSTVSLGTEVDDDYYAITVNQATELTLLVRPLGLIYDDSDQACPSNLNGFCCSGNATNSATELDPAIELLDTDGTSTLAFANSASFGGNETLTYTLPAAGTYYIAIKDSAVFTVAQFYTLTVSTKPATINVTVLDGGERNIPAGDLVPLRFNITGASESFDLANSRVFYRISFGATREAPIYDHGGNIYTAALADIPCNSTIEWYAELATSGAIVRVPCSGFTQTRSGVVTDVYSTDFTTNAAGWTVGPNTATAGFWERVVPIGSAAQPGADHSDTDDRCFVTGQGFLSNLAGSADIDGGSTILNSPTFSLAGQFDGEISYWRWYSNATGSAPYTDFFSVQISNNNGATWRTAEVVGPGSINDPEVNGLWFQKTIRLRQIGVTPSSAMRVRFTAQDTGDPSVVEAAIDDFAVRGFACTPTVWCSGDMTLDGLVDDTDFVVFASAYNELDCASPTMPVGCPSDLNNDGFVDDSDFVLFATAYNNLLCP
ncbi:MAG: pre-peptidase C-terminal domain-containing protein [Phycisphaerales bacterium]|nr:pre-peptidase C-terminal domain-containing protein [Phycisphaerales bacterium]